MYIVPSLKDLLPFNSDTRTGTLVPASSIFYTYYVVFTNLSGRRCENFRVPKSRPESVLVLSLEGRYLSRHGILGAAIKTYKKTMKYLFMGYSFAKDKSTISGRDKNHQNDIQNYSGSTAEYCDRDLP